MNIKRQLGFSLIEILVATSIIITTTTIVVAILASSFRTSSKTTSLDIVRQNGNGAISQVGRMIQFAESFEGVSEQEIPSSFVKSCPVPGSPDIRFNFLKIVSGGTEKMLSCSDEGFTIDGESLFDSNRVTVVTGTCSLTCTQDSPDVSPVIGLGFDLTFGTDPNPTSLTEKRAEIHFSTSVKMRNK